MKNTHPVRIKTLALIREWIAKEKAKITPEQRAKYEAGIVTVLSTNREDHDDR